MAIIRTPNTTGAKSNSTLSGNISLEQGLGELLGYSTIDGVKVLTYKIDKDGVHYYNTAGVELTRISADGISYYDDNGVLLSKIDGSGTHYYNTSGVEQTKISTDGFDYYDTSGNKRINIGASSAGMMRLEMFDADGTPRTLIGQNPADGDQVLAVSISGENVETNLSNNNRGGGGDDNSEEEMR